MYNCALAIAEPAIAFHLPMQQIILLWPYSGALFFTNAGAGYGFGRSCGPDRSVLRRYMSACISRWMFSSVPCTARLSAGCCLFFFFFFFCFGVGCLFCFFIINGVFFFFF